MSSTRQETTFKAKAEYYPRRSIRGKIVLVRNVNRRQSMMDRLTNPYALGIYTGAAATGMITGMAMMARRQGNERVVSQLRQATGASFGYATDLPYRKVKIGNIVIALRR